MKRPLRLQLEVKKNLLKRRGGEVLREIGRVVFLMGAIVFVTTALLIGYDWLLVSSHLRIRETVVKGCKELTEKDVLALAALGVRSNLMTVNREAIVRRIKENPWIKEVFVGREFPNRLIIWVQERKAVALIKKEQNLFLVDHGGLPFKKLENGEESDLPVITGCVQKGVLDEALLRKALVLLENIAARKDRPPIGVVSEVHGNGTFGLSLFTDAGFCLQFGFDGFENKLKQLDSVMADLDRKNLKTGFLLIDLSNPAKINVQRRNILETGTPRKPAVGGKGYRI